MVRGTATPKSARRKARKLKGKIAAKRKKEFLYRGLTLDELKTLPMEELLELLPARARRSVKRGMMQKNRRFFKHMERGDEVVRTQTREIIILPTMVGRRISIHDGRAFVDLTITPEMIGHQIGEFALTRKEVKHTGVGVGATRSSKFMPLK
jgi:small subunit ribosomal protein S19